MLHVAVATCSSNMSKLEISRSGAHILRALHDITVSELWC